MNQQEPSPPQPVTTRIKRYEFSGASSLVQVVGSLIILAGIVLGFHNATDGSVSLSDLDIVPFAIVAGAGLLLGILVMFIGSAMSVRYLCGNCQNTLTNKQARLCAVCRCRLQ